MNHCPLIIDAITSTCSWFYANVVTCCVCPHCVGLHYTI